MISTTCPGCSAKFQVPEDLVAGKQVRFRCRKCGGTIAVDGTAQASRRKTLNFGENANKAEPRPPSPDGPVPSIKPDDAPMSRSDMQAVLGTLRPSGESAAVQITPPAADPKFELDKTPPPPSSVEIEELSSGWSKPPAPTHAETPTAKTAEAGTKTTETATKDKPQPPPPPALKVEPKTAEPAAKPAEPVADGEAKPALEQGKLPRPAGKPVAPKEKVEAPKDKAEASKDKAEAPEKAGASKDKAEVSKDKAEASKDKAEAPKDKAEAPKDKAEAPKDKAEAPKDKAETAKAKIETGKEKAETPKPLPAKRLEKPAPPATKDVAEKADGKAKAESPRPGLVKADAKSKVEAEAPEAKGDTPNPPSSRRRLDGPSSKRSARISMELGGVFAVPEKASKGEDKGAEDVDVEIDLEAEEKPLDLEPIIARPPKPAPPAPQLKKVVLDLGDVGAEAPESRPMPSVAFFSPVLVPQMQLAQPAPQPLLEAPREEKSVAAAAPEAAKSGSGKGMLWAALIASAGILGAGGYLLWNSLQSSTPRPTPSATTETRTGERAPAASMRVAMAEPSATVEKAPEPPPATQSAAPPPAETAAKTNTDDSKKETSAPPSDTKKVAASTATAENTSTPAPAETKTSEPASTKPGKQPQPTETSDVPFDKAAASSAIAARKGAAAGCKQEGGPTGHAKVSITFAPTGRVTTANINGPPFAGTPVGGCIASKFRGATVPPFSGAPVTVHTTVAIF